MAHVNKTYHVGDVIITKIEEMRLNVAPPSFLYPEWDDAELATTAWIDAL